MQTRPLAACYGRTRRAAGIGKEDRAFAATGGGHALDDQARNDENKFATKNRCR
jgi:hypothetical protein